MNMVKLAAFGLMAIAVFSIFEGFVVLQGQPASSESLRLSMLWENGVYMMLIFSFLVFGLSLYIFRRGGRR